MITVSIFINGAPIFTRSGHRRTKKWAKGTKDAYLIDTGEQLYHNQNDGVVKLAIAMLETIKE